MLPAPFRLQSLGFSVQGQPLHVQVAEPAGASSRTLLIGGQHGDEMATIALLEQFCHEPFPAGAAVAIIPRANPDGCLAHTRYNARGVDLNRNCSHGWQAGSEEPSGPEPWSEPESRALRDFILHWRPHKIVSLHWALAEIDADGPQSRSLAAALWQALPAEAASLYRLRQTDQAALAGCPGSLGQWCGFACPYGDHGPAMITLELPYDHRAGARPEPLPADHLATVHRLWRDEAESYLAALRPGVFAMLQAALAHPSPLS